MVDDPHDADTILVQFLEVTQVVDDEVLSTRQDEVDVLEVLDWKIFEDGDLVRVL